VSAGRLPRLSIEAPSGATPRASAPLAHPHTEHQTAQGMRYRLPSNASLVDDLDGDEATEATTTGALPPGPGTEIEMERERSLPGVGGGLEQEFDGASPVLMLKSHGRMSSQVSGVTAGSEATMRDMAMGSSIRDLRGAGGELASVAGVSAFGPTVEPMSLEMGSAVEGSTYAGGVDDKSTVPAEASIGDGDVGVNGDVNVNVNGDRDTGLEPDTLPAQNASHSAIDPVGEAVQMIQDEFSVFGVRGRALSRAAQEQLDKVSAIEASSQATTGPLADI